MNLFYPLQHLGTASPRSYETKQMARMNTEMSFLVQSLLACLQGELRDGLLHGQEEEEEEARRRSFFTPLSFLQHP
jgi:hypothetical protein